MVNVQPKVLTELDGCKSFGFRVSSNFNESRKLKRPDSEVQRAICAQVKARLDALQYLPCEAKFQIGAKQGHQIWDGYVYPYDRSSREKAESIVGELNRETFSFSRTYPDSEFVITYAQTVTITRVD